MCYQFNMGYSVHITHNIGTQMCTGSYRKLANMITVYINLIIYMGVKFCKHLTGMLFIVYYVNIIFQTLHLILQLLNIYAHTRPTNTRLSYCGLQMG